MWPAPALGALRYMTYMPYSTANGIRADIAL